LPTIDRARELLENWSGAPARPIAVPPPAVPARRRIREIPMPGKSQTDIAYGFTTISRLDPRYHAYWILNNILGQFGLGGRLPEVLEAVTIDEVRAAAADVLHPERAAIAIAGPRTPPGAQP